MVDGKSDELVGVVVVGLELMRVGVVGGCVKVAGEWDAVAVVFVVEYVVALADVACAAVVLEELLVIAILKVDEKEAVVGREEFPLVFKADTEEMELSTGEGEDMCCRITVEGVVSVLEDVRFVLKVVDVVLGKVEEAVKRDVLTRFDVV